MANVTFNLEDFFNYYVSVGATDSIYKWDNEDVGFYKSIVLKKELGSNQPSAVDPLPAPGMFLPHQRFMARFLAPHTDYNRVLAFHGIGTGKTALYVAVTEYAKLVNPDLRQVVVLVSNRHLRKDALKKIVEATGDQYKVRIKEKESMLQLELEDKGLSTQELEERRTERNVKNTYKIMTFTEMANEVNILRRKQALQATYNNTYFFIDEAHNLKLRNLKTNKAPKDLEKEEKQTRHRTLNVYEQIHHLLHTVEGSKVMLLTATPMRDDPDELVDVLNLVLPSDRQVTKRDFASLFQEEKFTPSREWVDTHFKGYISYLRAMTSSVKIVNVGEIISPMKFMKIYPNMMSEFQSKIYAQAFLIDSPKDRGEEKVEEVKDASENEFTPEAAEGSTLWRESRFSSMIVFPDGTYSPTHEHKWLNLADGSGKYYNRLEKDAEGNRIAKQCASATLSDQMISYLEELDKPSDSVKEKLEKRLQQLRRLSAKFYFVIRQILENPNKKVFVYTEYVGSGALLFSAFLVYFGLARANTKTVSPGKRFIVLTSETSTVAQSAELQKIFNSPENDDGKIIQVVIGSSIIGEGVDFKSIRKTFVLTPFWNDATLEQAIGRSIRSFSHDRLKPEERKIEIYRLAATSEDVRSIDFMMYEVSEDKDLRIKSVERYMKEFAIDCALNRKRNVLESFEPLSKACDYVETCDYECVDVPRSMYNYEGPWIDDTYNLYYAEEEIKVIIENLKSLFKQKNAYDFEEMFRMLSRKISSLNSIVLARALYTSITMNIEFYNRNGFKNYLRTDRNMFFLVDDPLNGGLYSTAVYADRPFPNKLIESIDLQLDFLQNRKVEKVYNLIEEAITKEPERAEKVVESIFKYLSKKLVSLMLEQSFLAKLEGTMTPVDEVLMKRYVQFFKEKTFGSNQFYVNSYDETMERLAFKSNPSEWYDIAEISATIGDADEKAPNIVEEQEREREERINRLSSKSTNPYRYIANLNPTDSSVFNIKYIAPLKLKKTGEGFDKRELRITEGTSCKSEPFGRAGLLKMFFDIMLVARSQRINPPFSFNLKRVSSLNDLLTKLRLITSKSAKNSLWNEYVSNDPTKMNVLKEKWINTKGYNKLNSMTREQLFKFAEDVVKYLQAGASSAEVKKQIERLTLHKNQPDLEDFLMHQKAVQDYMFMNMLDEEDKKEGDIKMFAEITKISYGLLRDLLINNRIDQTAWNGWWEENKNSWDSRPFDIISNVFLPVSEGEYRKADDFCIEMKRWLIDNDLFLYVSKVEKEKKVDAGKKKK